MFLVTGSNKRWKALQHTRTWPHAVYLVSATIESNEKPSWTGPYLNKVLLTQTFNIWFTQCLFTCIWVVQGFNAGRYTIHSKGSVWVSLRMFLGFASWMLGKSKPKILSQTVMKNGGESPTKLNKQKELLTINPYKKLSFQKDHSIKGPLVPSLSEPRTNPPTFLSSGCLIRIQRYILNTT